MIPRAGMQQPGYMSLRSCLLEHCVSYRRAIAVETARRLGMGINILDASSVFGGDHDAAEEAGRLLGGLGQGCLLTTRTIT